MFGELNGVMLNIQGLTGNFAEIEELVLKSQYNFIILTETHITENIDLGEISIDGYNLYLCYSNSRYTGGVAVYVSKMLKSEFSNILAIENKLWILVVKIRIQNAIWNIVTLYRSPGMIVSDFVSSLENFLENNMKFGENQVVCGDFNIDYNAETNDKGKINALIKDFGLKQMVNEHTRITNSSKTIIDYVLVDHFTSVSVLVNKNWNISDHETLWIKLRCKSENLKLANQFSYICYNKEILFDELAKNNFNSLDNIDDINIISNVFVEKIQEALSKLSKTVTVKPNTVEWFNEELLRQKEEKIRLYNTFHLSEYNNEKWKEYKKYRNKYKKECNRVRDTYIENKINEKGNNQKAMWKAIKRYVLKKEKREINEVVINNTKIINEIDIANKLNEFFIDSISKLNDDIPIVRYNDNIRYLQNEFKFSQIDSGKLENIIKNISQKSDLMGLNTRIILDCKDIIFPILLKIVNGSLNEGKFPHLWKLSTIIPVEKIVNCKLAENMRPINTLPLYEKILEKVVCSQLEEHIMNNNIINEMQSGFRKGYSTETALNWIITEWKKFVDSGKKVLAVFLDLKRAFETVDRNILLNKMIKYGIRNKELSWFKNFLIGRTQCTKVNKSISDATQIHIGVPQGSILGVILFLLYINDISTALNYCKVSLFADDTLIYIVGDDIGDCERKMNIDLDNLFNWLNMNKLKLNVSKTKCMVIGYTSMLMNPHIKINNDEIECVKSIKYLGVIIDSKLNFNEHCDYVCKKIAKKLAFLGRIRSKVSKACAINIYNTIILPHFNYCSTILFLCNQQQLQRLQILQNRGMRIILKCGIRTHIRDMLNKLKWMNIRNCLTYNALVLIFKLKNNLLPSYMQRHIDYVGGYYYLRNRGDFRLPLYRKTSTQNSLLYKGTQVFNNLPSNIKNELRLSIFKKKIKEHLNT